VKFVSVQLAQNAQNVLSAELATVVNAIVVEIATAEIHVVTIVSRTDAVEL
jgi:low affinity Fe/Cu permease